VGHPLAKTTAIRALIPTTEVQILEATIVLTTPADLLRVTILLTVHPEVVAAAEVVECHQAEEAVVAEVSGQVEAGEIISDSSKLFYIL